MSDSYILKTRPSHLTNTFYYLFLAVISFVIFQYNDLISSFSMYAASFINSLVVHKGDEFVKMLAQSIFYSIVMLPLVFGVYRLIKTELNLFYFYDDRLVFWVGLANRHKENIEYYRIKDHYMNQPIHLRIFGLSTMTILSTDRRHPTLKLKGFRNLDDFSDELRVLIEKSRESGKGSEMDMV